MSTTPLWVPLVVAGMGFAGTVTGGVVGIVLTQRRADRRESQAWEREWLRERDRWAREDKARTFEHRREAYMDFYTSVKAMAKTAHDKCFGLMEDMGNNEPDDDWPVETNDKLERLQFYADPELAAAAAEAFSAACAWGVRGTYNAPNDPDLPDLEFRYYDAEVTMLALMRNRLAIREGDAELPSTSYSQPGFARDPD